MRAPSSICKYVYRKKGECYEWKIQSIPGNNIRHLYGMRMWFQEPVEETEAPESCFVYVCGAVNCPGVYELPPKSRVYEAIRMAGGVTEDAGSESVNQAEYVTDGQMRRIPTEEGELAAEKSSGNTDQAVDDGLLNINSDSAADFMTLPGIGQSKADALVKYREEHGGFSSIEEIMQVDGIKEGVFHKIKDSIKVN